MGYWGQQLSWGREGPSPLHSHTARTDLPNLVFFGAMTASKDPSMKLVPSTSHVDVGSDSARDSLTERLTFISVPVPSEGKTSTGTATVWFGLITLLD